MRRKSFIVSVAWLPALALLGAGTASGAFGPVVPSIPNRPAVLLETDYYVYGPDTGFTDPELNLTLTNRRDYNSPVTLYLYWENRESGQRAYYSVPEGGFVGGNRDLFGTANAPVKLVAPDLTDFQLFGPEGALGPVPPALPTTTGHYQFILELRDANGQQVIARSNAMYNYVDTLIQVSGQLNQNATWTSNNAYYLATPVNVGVTNPAILTIEPGTVILGSTAGQGVLVIRQGAEIQANGTPELPIIFTSEQPVGSRAPGDWGGLVINGRAPTNQQNPLGEGDSGPYGGNQPNDSSGTLHYVRVEFAGILFSETNELNGIALQGVGRGTVIDHVQVHFNADDGIEFFGGTVNVKYVLITDARDDSFDWTFGWTGKVQHVVTIQRHEQADNGIEADNFEDDANALPISDPTIYNATFIGNGPVHLNDPTAESGHGWLLRRGTEATIGNCIVTNFWEQGILVDGPESNAMFGDQLRVENSFFFRNELGGDGFAVAPSTVGTLYAQRYGNRSQNPQLPNPNSLVQPDVAPLRGSPARNAGGTAPNDGFFDQVTYAGGVDPEDPWIDDGWTTFSDN